MFKKMTVLAMAVGLVAALALPATASAKWKHGHVNEIPEDVTINFTGNARFQGGLGGVECQLTPSLLFKKGQTTGTVEQFTAHPTDETTNCKGLGGLAPCQIHNLTPQHDNTWVFHTIQPDPQQPKVNVTVGDITSQATGGFFCLVKHIKLTAPVNPNHFVTLLPNQPNTFTGGEIHGQMESDIQTNNGTVHKETVTVSGSFTIKDALKKHTYSI